MCRVSDSFTDSHIFRVKIHPSIRMIIKQEARSLPPEKKKNNKRRVEAGKKKKR